MVREVSDSYGNSPLSEDRLRKDKRRLVPSNQTAPTLGLLKWII